MKAQYFTVSGVDGFIATPEDSLEWLFPLGDIADTSYPAFFAEVGVWATGSATYEWLLPSIVQPDRAPTRLWLYAQPTWGSRPVSCPTNH